MRLSRLEMQGFKSFAKKTELIISDGVTAVIGPNGSGKSNLSDAIRWVLGEQSARALRGNKMEDVIFNGTEVKRPLSMCSVSLSFENTDRTLGLDCDEITVTRRAFRSGEGEYAINGKDCRLKDILDLFRDTGIGKDGYSIISQGRVDEILSNRTQDRREALEEAAGVTRFRARRDETTRKLAQAQRNIERLEAILNELGTRLSPLKTESEKAKRSLALLEELKALEINHFLKETEKNNAKLEALSAILLECAKAEQNNREEDDSLRAQIEEKEAELRERENEMSLAREEQFSILSSHERIQSAIQIETERVRTSEVDCSRLREELSEIDAKIKHNASLLSGEEDNDPERIAGLKRNMEETEADYESACVSVEKAENELEELKSSIMNTLNRLGQSRSDRSRLETMKESLLKRIASIKTETEELSGKYADLQREYDTEENELQNNQDILKQKEEEIHQTESEREQSEIEKHALEKELQQVDSGLISAQSNLCILRDLVKKREGFQSSVRLLMNDASKDPELSASIVGLIAEMITVPKEYETAIGTALGASMQYIVSPNGNDAKRIIEHVRKKQYGRVTVLPIDILRRYDPDKRLNQFLAKPDVLGIAKDLIFYNEKAAFAIDFLLGRTLIVRDISCALSLRKEDGCYLQIVTLGGDMLQSSGILSGGSKTKKSFDILSREREIAELDRTIGELQTRKKTIDGDLRKAEEHWKETGALLYIRQNEINETRIEIERIKDRIGIIERDLEVNCGLTRKLEEEEESSRDSIASITIQLDALNNEETTLRNVDSSDKQKVIEKQKTVQNLRILRDQKLKLFTDAKINVASAEKDELVRIREKEKIQAESEALRDKSSAIDSKIIETEALAKRSGEECARLNIQADQVSGELDLIRARIDSILEQITDIKEAANTKRRRRDELLADNREILEKQSRTETSISKLKTQQEQLTDSVWQDYELTYENALPFRFETPVSGITEKITSLKTKIKEIGPVNPGSIQEYANVSVRFEELSKQLQDINRASEDLEDLIDKLTKTMERTFQEGFFRICKEFETVFSELFAGGKAELRLKDPSDVLNSDIEIIAQPPGKKLQLLSLMSGGERALTAIALLFAMLRIKSPSFCVLDEIETSLDEENVNRFASFLKQYGKETQFIVITHRKGSMEAANSIYGVSMEEKGISSIVSAKWEGTA